MQISKGEKLNFLFAGLVLFYVSQFFIGSKPVYFLTFFATVPFFYLAVRNISIAVMLTLILSLFFEVGIAGRLFLLEPRFLNLGSGWWITPKTVLVLSLLGLTVVKWKSLRLKKILLPDIMLVFFLGWLVISFIFQININFLFGLLSLFETALIYYLLRINLDKKNTGLVVLVLSSVVLFQFVLSVFQIMQKRPLGLVIESTLTSNPYSLTTIEGGDFFRISGSYGHPNMLAAVLLSLSPFLIHLRPLSVKFAAVDAAIFFLVFFTYSRITWFFFIIQYAISFSFNRIKSFSLNILRHKNMLLLLLLVFINIYLVTPNLLGRLRSTGFSLEEYGSLGLRVKLMQEGLNLISKNPILGTGLHRSLEIYARDPVTNIFSLAVPGPFYRIHNTFLEIAAETGMPGLILFLLFIYYVFYSFIAGRKQNLSKTSAILGLAGLIIISYLNPFFHTIVMDIIILFSAFILA